MNHQHFIKQVIMSCKNHDQLQSCIQWVDRLDLHPVIRESIVMVVRIKAQSLKTY
jgi:hypothetical protein